MTIPKTKLRPPTLRQPIVSRPRLTETFITRRPLTVVSAPAGSGKTTLALEWLNSNKGRVAWLSLDADDNDPIRFINGCISALQTTGLKLRKPAGQRDIKAIMAGLINQFEDGHPTTLVFDDYHLIHEEKIHAALTYLLDHIPDSLQLVIVSREAPPLPLARLRARGQLREFNLDDLRFTPDETKQFLHQVMGLDLPPQEIEKIGNHTQGWAAGLQMTGLSMLSNHEQVAPNRSESQFISDYFLSEVLLRQPVEIQSFLLNSSILEKFSVSQCSALFSKQSAKSITHITNANLFISKVGNWYQYHPLFREFLQTNLQSQQPENLLKLHAKVRNWYEKNGYIAEAIPHAFASSDFDSAAKLISILAPDYFKRGELVTLRRWLDRLPESAIWHSPRLCLTQIWLLLDSNLQQDAQLYLERLGKHLEKNLRGEFLALRALHAAMSQKPELAMKYAIKAKKTREAKDPFIQTYVTFGLGAAQKMAVDLPSAEQSFKSALTLSEATGNSYIALSAWANLSDVQYLQAKLSEAERTCKSALRRYTDNSSDSNDWYWTFARIAYQRNELDKALELINHAIDLAEEWRTSGTQLAHAIVQRSVIHFAIGNKEEAWADLDSAEVIAEGLQTSFTSRTIARQRVLYDVADKNLEGARKWFNLLTEYDQTPYLFYFLHVKGRVLLLEEKTREAIAIFREALKELDAQNNNMLRIEVLIWLAVALHHSKNKAQAVKMLSSAIKLAKPGQVIRPFVEATDALLPLIHSSGMELGRDGIARALTQSREKREQAEDAELTRREKEILELLANGLSNQEMAEKLVIAEGTLKRHIANLYQKLGVHNRAQAIRYLHLQ